MDLKRWKSVDTVDLAQKYAEEYFVDQRSHSEASLEACVLACSEASSPAPAGSARSLPHSDDGRLHGKLSAVEKKIDELYRLLQEQLCLVAELRRELAARGRGPARSADGDDNYLQAFEQLAASGPGGPGSSRARSLLDAIELKHLQRIDFQIKNSISKFLQSDDLKAHLASATVDSLKHVMQSCLSETLSRAYLPALDHSYRRLFKVVTKILHGAFHELEASSAAVLRSPRAARDLRAALEQHQALLAAARPPHFALRDLQDVLEEVLQNELKEWRGRLFEVLMSELHADAGAPPPSPPPPPPHSSAVNQLMKSAVIKKHIEEGHLNESFDEALSSGDLALVVAACRGAEPARVFGPPCRLRQPVLLSLVQQLVTDMVHDTHLKCRYLEEAITKLDTSEAGTRAHLPLVVHEVRTHLTRFLHAYPGHVAATRITLIIMAANNLIK